MTLLERFYPESRFGGYSDQDGTVAFYGRIQGLLAPGMTVLEHVDDPVKFFAEVERVLKPGGIFCARTTNRLGYVGLAASLIPNRRHARVLGKVQRDRKEIDVFPTRYRINTVWRLRAALKRIGFEGAALVHAGALSYLSVRVRAQGCVVVRLMCMQRLIKGERL